MIRKFFKRLDLKHRFQETIHKYKIPHEYLVINRKSVSRAMFVGLFVAFIPMPLQMVAVLFFMPFFTYNALLAIALVWITNPITMPFIYYIEYITGNFLLMQESTLQIELTIEWFQTHLDDIFIALYVGAFFYSVVFGALGYFLTNILWRSSVKRAECKKRGKC